METKDYLKTFQKLKKELDLLSKDKDRIFFSAKSILRDEISELTEVERDLTSKQDSASRAIFSQIFRLKRQVSEITKKLQTFVNATKTQGISSDYDQVVSSLQKAADLVNSEILDFKEKSRVEYEDLLSSEKILFNELEYFTNKFSS